MIVLSIWRDVVIVNPLHEQFTCFILDILLNLISSFQIHMKVVSPCRKWRLPLRQMNWAGSWKRGTWFVRIISNAWSLPNGARWIIQRGLCPARELSNWVLSLGRVLLIEEKSTAGGSSGCFRNEVLLIGLMNIVSEVINGHCNERRRSVSVVSI